MAIPNAKYFNQIAAIVYLVKKFFLKIYELAKEYIAQEQIDKLGGYILDEDLQQAINDTKRVMNAQSQIEVLHSQVEKIRKKYQ